MPAQPASASVRERLRAALPPALKAHDAVAVAALRRSPRSSNASARRAGLVTRRRKGRRVIYTRTATGDDLRAHH